MIKKAQSILEYVIVLSAIVAAVIAAANGPVKTAVSKMFSDSSETMSTATDNFKTNVGK